MKKLRRKSFIVSAVLIMILICSLYLTSCSTTKVENGDASATPKEYTAEDLHNSKIASVVGSNESIYLREQYPDSEIMEYNNAADALAALRSKKVDYFVTLNSMINIYAQNLNDIRNTHCELIKNDAGFALQKGNDELLSKLNEKVKEYKENGCLEEMISHWTNENDYKIVEVPENQNGETIIVGTTGELEPLNFYMDNKLVGIDVEIIGNILYDLGYKVEYKCMAFGALMPALESGKIDIIASSLYITEERKKSVDFTDVYYSDPSTFVVLDEIDSENTFTSDLKEGLYNNLIKEERYKMIIDGLKMTGALALTSAIFGTLFGILLCLMKRSRFKILKAVKGTFSVIIQGTPMVVILMIVCYVILGKADINGVIVGMIAFGMVFGNDVCGAIENGLNNIEPGQYEAIAALGYPKNLGFRKIILPQMIRNFLPLYRSSFTSMIKATAIAGYVAIQDLTKAGDIIRSRTFDAFIPLIVVAVIYFVIVWLVTLILKWIEKSEDRKRRKRKVRI